MTNQFLGNADTATTAANATKVNNQYYNSWTAYCQYNVWSRILYIATSQVIGAAYLINIRSTRGNFVVNKTLLVSYQHSVGFNIAELNDGTYSTIQVRGVVGNNGQGYFEILDSDGPSYSGNQAYEINFHMLVSGINVLPITTFQSGATLPDGFKVSGTKTLGVIGLNADRFGSKSPNSYAQIGQDNSFGNVTNTQRKIKVRHIDGLETDDSSYGNLYLNYYANKSIMLGLNGGATISADGKSYSGNAATSTKWATARTITVTGNATGSVSFDGSANATLNLTNTYATSAGSASTATQLATSRNIFGQPFNGTANVAGKGIFYGTYTSTPGVRYSNSALEIRECGLVMNTQTDVGYAPRIGFHWAGSSGGTLTYMPGQFQFRNQADTGYLEVRASTFIGNLSGTASYAATSEYAGMVNGLYTGSGGNQPPSYIPKGKVRFNMMRGLTGYGDSVFSGYCDCMLMDTYTGSDVPIATGFGIARVSGNPRAWIFNGNQGGTKWNACTELITGSNISAQSVSYSTNSGQLGGVAAANYINTSDTLILRGVV